MGTIKTIITVFILFILASFVYAGEAKKNLKAFPEASKGMVRHVIIVPKKMRENDYQVEVVAGKVVETDGVNSMRLDYSVKRETLKGWGYTYYVVDGSGMAMSTMMAPSPEQEKVEQFVGGTPKTIRYNSRLPIVVYAPEGVQVRYRIWEAPPEFKEVE